jgi:hypothetical protein
VEAPGLFRFAGLLLESAFDSRRTSDAPLGRCREATEGAAPACVEWSARRASAALLPPALWATSPEGENLPHVRWAGAGIERAVSPVISTSNATISTRYNFLPRTYPRRSGPLHTLGVPVAGGGRLDPARSGDGDGAERGRDGLGRRVEATSLSQKDGQTPSGSRVGVKRGATGRGIVNPPIAHRRGSRRIADRPWCAPVRGLLGIRAETRSLGPILTQEQLLRSGRSNRNAKHHHGLRVRPGRFASSPLTQRDFA